MAALALDKSNFHLKLRFSNLSDSTIYLWDHGASGSDWGSDKRYTIGVDRPYIYYAGDQTAVVLMAMRAKPLEVESPIGPYAVTAVLTPGSAREKDFTLSLPLHELTEFTSMYHPTNPNELNVEPTTYEISTVIVLWDYWNKHTVNRLMGEPSPAESDPGVVLLKGYKSIPTSKLTPSDASLVIGRQITSTSGVLIGFHVLNEFQQFAAAKLTLPQPIKIIVDYPAKGAYPP